MQQLAVATLLVIAAAPLAARAQANHKPTSDDFKAAAVADFRAESGVNFARLFSKAFGSLTDAIASRASTRNSRNLRAPNTDNANHSQQQQHKPDTSAAAQSNASLAQIKDQAAILDNLVKQIEYKVRRESDDDAHAPAAEAQRDAPAVDDGELLEVDNEPSAMLSNASVADGFQLTAKSGKSLAATAALQTPPARNNAAPPPYAASDQQQQQQQQALLDARESEQRNFAHARRQYSETLNSELSPLSGGKRATRQPPPLSAPHANAEPHRYFGSLYVASADSMSTPANQPLMQPLSNDRYASNAFDDDAPAEPPKPSADAHTAHAGDYREQLNLFPSDAFLGAESGGGGGGVGVDESNAPSPLHYSSAGLLPAAATLELQQTNRTAAPPNTASVDSFDVTPTTTTTNTSALHQRQQHLQRQPGHKTGYVAALANITSPIVGPTSASESMELDIRKELADAAALQRDSSAGSTVAAANAVAAELSKRVAHSQTPTATAAAAGGERMSAAADEEQQQQQQASQLNDGLPASDRERMRLGDGSAARYRPTVYMPNGSLSSSPMPSSLPPQQQQVQFGGVVPGTRRTQASGLRSPQLPPPVSGHMFPPSHYHPNKAQQQSSYYSPSALLMNGSGNGLPRQTQSLQFATFGASTTLSPLLTTDGFSTSFSSAQQQQQQLMLQQQQQQQQQLAATTAMPATMSTGVQLTGNATSSSSAAAASKFPLNLTRVEHISAECSNDMIRALIIFNGTFKGLIYSAGFVQDQNCMYVNGTGKTHYNFNIRLNTCGTRKQIESRMDKNDTKRQDQVMSNTLSVQYNPLIEQEWDEHFRVTCEYGSDFWKTVSFSPFSVQTNTGAPVVFTIDPPECQMGILKGHGIVGTRQEPVSGPVTVGDPLTLLIHMRSERSGYDILVKNCIAHNGSNQKIQLIDSNGCVVNERFISPFRGAYKDNNQRHLTLYSYLKAFRFTGSSVLYLECEIHMCQSACPPQMCYWRRLSKRSPATLAGDDANSTTTTTYADYDDQASAAADAEPMKPPLTETGGFVKTSASFRTSARQSRALSLPPTRAVGSDRRQTTPTTSSGSIQRPTSNQLSDSMNLVQALEVREPTVALDERGDAAAAFATADAATEAGGNVARTERLSRRDDSFASEPGVAAGGRADAVDDDDGSATAAASCFARSAVYAYLAVLVSLLVVTASVSAGCVWQARCMRQFLRKHSGDHSAPFGGCSSPPLQHQQSALASTQPPPRATVANKCCSAMAMTAAAAAAAARKCDQLSQTSANNNSGGGGGCGSRFS